MLRRQGIRQKKQIGSDERSCSNQRPGTSNQSWDGVVTESRALNPEGTAHAATMPNPLYMEST